MADFEIAVVSAQTPREWQGNNGLMKTYKVKFKGDDRAIEVNKPATDEPPKVGDTFQGEILETQYGFRLKQVKQFAGGKGRSFQPRDDKEIRAQMAVKTAATVVGVNDPKAIKELATSLYEIVDDLKLKQSGADVKAVMGGGNDFDKPLELSDIPF